MWPAWRGGRERRLLHSPPLFAPQDWLTRYGYLPPPHPGQLQLRSPLKLRDAVKVMQRFAGLPETGVLGRCPSWGCPLRILVTRWEPGRAGPGLCLQAWEDSQNPYLGGALAVIRL